MLADIIVYSTLLVVWDYVASAAKSTSRAAWAGHPARFVVLALGLSMVFGGCAGVAASRAALVTSTCFAKKMPNDAMAINSANKNGATSTNSTATTPSSECRR